MVLAPGGDRIVQAKAGAVGAFVVLALMVTIGRRSWFSPERMILADTRLDDCSLGPGLGAAGCRRSTLGGLLTWMAGSTYRAGIGDAIFASSAAAIMMTALPLVARLLDILWLLWRRAGAVA